MIGSARWTWRESNPRPDKAPERFLHAYPLIELSGGRLVQRQTFSLLSRFSFARR